MHLWLLAKGELTSINHSVKEIFPIPFPARIAGIGPLGGCHPTILLPLLQCIIQDSICQHNKDCRHLFYHLVVEALGMSSTLPLSLEELVLYILWNLLSEEVAGSVLMILLVLHLPCLRMWMYLCWLLPMKLPQQVCVILEQMVNVNETLIVVLESFQLI